MKFVPESHQTSILPQNDTFAADNLLSRGQEIAVDVDEDSAELRAREEQLKVIFGGQDWGQKLPRRLKILITII